MPLTPSYSTVVCTEMHLMVIFPKANEIARYDNNTKRCMRWDLLCAWSCFVRPNQDLQCEFETWVRNLRDHGFDLMLYGWMLNDVVLRLYLNTFVRTISKTSLQCCYNYIITLIQHHSSCWDKTPVPQSKMQDLFCSTRRDTTSGRIPEDETQLAHYSHYFQMVSRPCNDRVFDNV